MMKQTDLSFSALVKKESFYRVIDGIMTMFKMQNVKIGVVVLSALKNLLYKKSKALTKLIFYATLLNENRG